MSERCIVSLLDRVVEVKPTYILLLSEIQSPKGHLNLYINIYIYIYLYTHTYIYMCVCVCVCMCVYIYIYIYWNDLNALKKFFRHFIAFLLKSNLKRTIIGWESAFAFSKKLQITQTRGFRSGFRSYLIAVFIVFLWTFFSLVCFFIDVVGSFLITVVRAV